MNFLAHCALAHDAALAWECSDTARQGLLAGAVLGDFVKGEIPRHWPDPLRAGARLHRKIDALSNQNPHIRKTCERFPEHLRRFAPIFVDMMADHCLSHTWQDYYQHHLPDFSTDCYNAMAVHDQHLTPNATRFVDYMQEVNLLSNYGEWAHVARGLKSVLRRLNRESWFDDVNAHCQALLQDSRQDFSAYYPQLQNAWSSWSAFEAIAAPRSS